MILINMFRWGYKPTNVTFGGPILYPQLLLRPSHAPALAKSEAYLAADQRVAARGPDGIICTRWCPLVINWFINPINYGYITYKPQLLEL